MQKERTTLTLTDGEKPKERFTFPFEQSSLRIPLLAFPSNYIRRHTRINERDCSIHYTDTSRLEKEKYDGPCKKRQSWNQKEIAQQKKCSFFPFIRTGLIQMMIVQQGNMQSSLDVQAADYTASVEWV